MKRCGNTSVTVRPNKAWFDAEAEVVRDLAVLEMQDELSKGERK